jgi:RNA polymerase sigma factor (sigma-70 family)
MQSTAQTLHNEKTLVHRAKLEPAAFAEIYDHYFPRIYRYIFYRLQDAQLADDLTAQTFEETLRSITRYQPERGPFAVWIFAIARNIIKKHLRAQRIRQWVSLDAIAHHAAEDTPHLEEVLLHQDRLAHLVHHLSELDERQRDLIALKFSAGFTNRRISELTGLSESNVGVILYRTLRRLRDRIQESEDDEG